MRSELPVRTGTAAKPAQPLVRLAKAGGVSGDEVLREKSELMDPTPLFFPTKWNYGQRPLQEGRLKQPGQVFGSFEPKLTVGEQNIANYGAEATPVPEKLVDVLVQGNEAPFAGMGQIDAQRSTLTVRAGYLEVREQKNGNIITAQQLSGIVIPRPFSPAGSPVRSGESGGLSDRGVPQTGADSGWASRAELAARSVSGSRSPGSTTGPNRASENAPLSIGPAALFTIKTEIND